MPASVVSISTGTTGIERSGIFSLLAVAQPGTDPVAFGILFADDSDHLVFRLRDVAFFDDLSEQERDIFAALGSDLEMKGRESGGRAVLAALEDSASYFFRVTDSASISYTGSAQATVDRLFAQRVLETEAASALDSRVIPFVTHLPLYGLRAAATKFGELMESEREGWVRAPERLRLSEGMFVAQVVGRSMEPRIPDGSFCIFRGPVTGSRQGRLVLGEKLDETDFASRFTVKRYARHGVRDESAERTETIVLEPLNKEFAAFELEADQFRVIAEFVQTLPPGALPS